MCQHRSLSVASAIPFSVGAWDLLEKRHVGCLVGREARCSVSRTLQMPKNASGLWCLCHSGPHHCSALSTAQHEERFPSPVVPRALLALTDALASPLPNGCDQRNRAPRAAWVMCPPLGWGGSFTQITGPAEGLVVLRGKMGVLIPEEGEGMLDKQGHRRWPLR